MTELLDGIDTMELRGRRQRTMSAVAVRPLQEADLAVLAAGARQPTPPRSIQRLRDRHHAIARLLAAGKTNNEVSVMTGMDPARISVLRSDPTFKQLVEDYRKIETGQEANFVERLQMLGMTAVEELQDRLENAEEPIPIQTLLEVSKFASDRTGHGPVTKQMNTNVNVELSSRLASARKRALPGPVTDAEFTEVSGHSSDIVRNGTDG